MIKGENEMGSSNYQLVLLDNLIYLDEVMKVEEKRTTIRIKKIA